MNTLGPFGALRTPKLIWDLDHEKSHWITDRPDWLDDKKFNNEVMDTVRDNVYIHKFARLRELSTALADGTHFFRSGHEHWGGPVLFIFRSTICSSIPDGYDVARGNDNLSTPDCWSPLRSCRSFNVVVRITRGKINFVDRNKKLVFKGTKSNGNIWMPVNTKLGPTVFCPEQVEGIFGVYSERCCVRDDLLLAGGKIFDGYVLTDGVRLSDDTCIVEPGLKIPVGPVWAQGTGPTRL